jgi:acetyl-CoA C-acetyltransferase
MLRDGLESPWSGKHMAQEATEVAAELEITRADMDRWSVRSHERAIAAIDEGRMAEEIVAVTVTARREQTVVETDEAPRRETTLEALAKLPAIFVADGTHTAGNSPGVNDGAAALVIASEDWAKANSREPLAAIVAHAQAADDFPYLARSPALAAQKALAKAGLRAADVDVWEINEAFASVVLQSIRILSIDEQRVNVNGGAVALGHPIGASGARILATLVNELRRRGGGIGCAAICSGGAQGDAVIVRA